MQKVGLTAAELPAYHRALRGSHTKTIKVAVLNLAGETLASITPTVIDGQVVVNLDSEVTRSLTLTFLDPRHLLNFDSDSPDDGALYADRMLRVYYTVNVPELGKNVTAVPFTGVITKLDRKGDVVDVEAQGKERLALGESWRALTVKKGTPKVDAIRTILTERAGESRFSLPTLKTRLPKSVSLNRMSKPWKVAKHIAHSLDRQLFYPGNGTCTLRQYPGTPVYTFSTDDGGMLSDLAISTDMEQFVNTVLVVGGKPKGGKHRVQAQAIAPSSHPLSPTRLGRNGVGRHMVLQVSNDHIRSKVEAQKKAHRVLEDHLRQTVSVTFDAMPMPHLDEGDLIRVKDGATVVTFRLRQFSIPLGTDGDPVMPVGYHKLTQIRPRRIRRA